MLLFLNSTSGDFKTTPEIPNTYEHVYSPER